jgi:hypothetical protein
VNSDEHFDVANEEDVSSWMDAVANEESSNFNPVLKSEVANDKAYDWYDAISLPEAFQFPDYVHSDLKDDIFAESYNKVNGCEHFQAVLPEFSEVLHPSFNADISTESNSISRCNYVPAVHLESLEYAASLDSNIDIFVVSDKVEENRCKYDSVVFPEFSEFSSSSQNMIEHVKDSMQMSTEETEVFDEAWLFGKVLWVTMLQIAFGFKFDNEGVARSYQCCFKLVEHLPLFREGSYFSLPVNGHV